MEKHRAYAIILHTGENSSKLAYESACCDGETKEEAEVRLHKWMSLRKKSCKVYKCSCRETNMVVDELTPDIRASGALENMVKIE
jgi:hypothetical protein